MARKSRIENHKVFFGGAVLNCNASAFSLQCFCDVKQERGGGFRNLLRKKRLLEGFQALLLFSFLFSANVTQGVGGEVD